MERRLLLLPDGTRPLHLLCRPPHRIWMAAHAQPRTTHRTVPVLDRLATTTHCQHWNGRNQRTLTSTVLILHPSNSRCCLLHHNTIASHRVARGTPKEINSTRSPEALLLPPNPVHLWHSSSFGVDTFATTTKLGVDRESHHRGRYLRFFSRRWHRVFPLKGPSLLLPSRRIEGSMSSKDSIFQIYPTANT